MFEFQFEFGGREKSRKNPKSKKNRRSKSRKRTIGPQNAKNAREKFDIEYCESKIEKYRFKLSKDITKWAKRNIMKF